MIIERADSKPMTEDDYALVESIFSRYNSEHPKKPIGQRIDHYPALGHVEVVTWRSFIDLPPEIREALDASNYIPR